MSRSPYASANPLTRRWTLPSASSIGFWGALIALPFLVNVLAWRFLVVPQRAALRSWRNARAFTEGRPTLTALLSESDQVLADWRRSSFTSDDPAAVMQAVEQLAGRHHVQLKQLRAAGTTAPAERTTGSATGTTPVEVEATGRFNQLAHWMSDVETQSGLQMDSWELAPIKTADQSYRLTVRMTAFLQGV